MSVKVAIGPLNYRHRSEHWPTLNRLAYKLKLPNCSNILKNSSFVYVSSMCLCAAKTYV